MMKLIILMGLPGSGKTTYARELCAKDSTMIRINRDDLRTMCRGEQYQYQYPLHESVIAKLRDICIAQALFAGCSVVSDDTNLTNHAIQTLQTIAKLAGASVEVIQMQCSTATCIERDSQRAQSVGKDAISRLLKTWLDCTIIPDQYIVTE